MPAPNSIPVAASGAQGTQLVPALNPGQKHAFIVLGRQDAASDRVLLSFGEPTFTNGNAAFWISAGEKLIITPDQGLPMSLASRGIWARSASGTINVQVQLG